MQYETRYDCDDSAVGLTWDEFQNTVLPVFPSVQDQNLLALASPWPSTQNYTSNYCGMDVPQEEDNMLYPYGSEETSYVSELLSRNPPEEISGWNKKFVRDWTTNDTVAWISETAVMEKFKISRIPLYRFGNITGASLCKMSKDDICEILNLSVECKLLGEKLYEMLQNFLAQEASFPVSVIERSDNHLLYMSYCEPSDPVIYDLDRHHNSGIVDSLYITPGDSGCESNQSDDFETSYTRSSLLKEEAMLDAVAPTIVKKSPGRPKGSGRKLPKKEKNVSVPEFLRHLLLDPKFCPRIIKWEEYSKGTFRFVKANEVAKEWGDLKKNKKMNFEKFSRAMRYHYKQDVLVSVPTARLVYQFGPKGPDYTTDNPNFENHCRNNRREGVA